MTKDSMVLSLNIGCKGLRETRAQVPGDGQYKVHAVGFRIRILFFLRGLTLHPHLIQCPNSDAGQSR